MKVVFAALFACTCAASTVSPLLKLWPKTDKGRITGGSDADRNQFPYQISFQWGMPGDFLHLCGGAILSPTYAVTSAQCIAQLPAPGVGTIRVLAGVLDIKEEGVAVDIAETLLHPDYEGGVAPNDLALIHLAKALTFSESVQPIGLPAPDAEPEGRAFYSGWGSTGPGNFPDILQYVDVPILTYEECADALTALFGDFGIFDETMVCTGPLGDEGISACFADSGTPLAQQGSNELIGVVSWGVDPCGTPGAPTVFTKVSKFIDFIRANVPDLPDSSKKNLD